MAVVAAVVLPLSAAGGYVAAKRLIHVEETSAPDLIAMPVDEALAKASEQGFSLQLERMEPVDYMEAGSVLAQRPSPDSVVKAGATIRVTVASAP